MTLTIALDAMGGDHAPQIVIAGADLARERFPGLRFLLYGDQHQLNRCLVGRSALTARATIEHTPDQVGADAKPSQVLRQGRNTSMRLAIDAVRDGHASAAVSAGNTGALMALAKFALKTLPGIERPAIATLVPTRRSEAVVLDLGANTECDAANLVQFAVMGEVFARAVLGFAKPTVGLLNIGTEDVKGHDRIREAAAALRASDLPIEFRGFVEGTDLTSGKVDVVVTDGFTGNVALKVAEGTVALYGQFLRERVPELAARQARLFAGAAGPAAGPPAARPAALQRRHVPGPERDRREEPRQYRCARFRQRHRGRGRPGAARHQRADHRRAPPARARGAARPPRAGLLTRRPGGMIRARIIGSGAYLPARVVSNDELARTVDTNDAWIVERTGIRQRHIAADGELTSDLARAAAAAALANAGIGPERVDLIVVATSTPDHTFPACAMAVQRKLGALHAVGFDLQAVCSGFIFALAVADKFLVTGQARTALVIGSETFSRLLDWQDRTTCVLFGDGAGAVVLRAETGTGTTFDRGLLATHLGGRRPPLRRPLRRRRTVLDRHHRSSADARPGGLPARRPDPDHGQPTGARAADLTIDDVDWLVPHQANRRILDAVAKRLGIAEERVLVTVDRHANTSAASIPLALAEAADSGRLQAEQLIVMNAMGGGFTWGAALARW